MPGVLSNTDPAAQPHNTFLCFFCSHPAIPRVSITPLSCQSFCLWHQSTQKEWDSIGILFWRNNLIVVLFGCHVNSFVLWIINRTKLLWYDHWCSLELPGPAGCVLCTLFFPRWGCRLSLVPVLRSWNNLRSPGPWNQGDMLLMP